ncbi:ribonucleotide-diphosphate reductase subunit alpha [Acetobacter orientalis]|uniref:Ribonucleotide-diphosphate reductase subunit alpha n=1 Tax=Acetobacter orientalis TaxID=146474 RepID=A0A2Z5ZDT3_9PROT|nr:ribonucleotide-diphosphate reductase subunit alpha [Acetobacter orientalis]
MHHIFQLVWRKQITSPRFPWLRTTAFIFLNVDKTHGSFAPFAFDSAVVELCRHPAGHTISRVLARKCPLYLVIFLTKHTKKRLALRFCRSFQRS